MSHPGARRPSKRLLPSFKTCYFCGTENRHGFGIRYAVDGKTGAVGGTFVPDEYLCGYPGILHGGLQGALLDDVMYWAVAHAQQTSSVTLELRTRFVKTASLGGRFLLRATCRSAEGRKAWAAGTLQSPDGDTVAEAEGLYLLHEKTQFRRDILPFFDFEGCDPTMVDRFSA